MTNDAITTSRPGAPPGRQARWRLWNLAATAAITCYSTGIAWQAQLVSYPLFLAVGADDFPAYHQAYHEAIPLVVIVPGFVGFVACTVFPWTRSRDVPRRVGALVALSGIGAIASTVFWAIPRHDTLDRIGRDVATVQSLLQANALRTAVLTVGAGALLWSVVRAMTPRPRQA